MIPELAEIKKKKKKRRRNRSRSSNRNLLWTQVPIGKLVAEFYINTYVHASMGFPCGSADKESAYNVGDVGWEDPVQKGTARNGYPLQYSGLENFMDCIVHEVAKSQI